MSESEKRQRVFHRIERLLIAYFVDHCLVGNRTNVAPKVVAAGTVVRNEQCQFAEGWECLRHSNSPRPPLPQDDSQSWKSKGPHRGWQICAGSRHANRCSIRRRRSARKTESQHLNRRSSALQSRRSCNRGSIRRRASGETFQTKPEDI